MYPWTFPTIAPQSINFTLKSLVPKFTSPFSGKLDLTRGNLGQWFELALTFPPLSDTNAQQLSGFITGLLGQDGTFYYKLPSMFLLPASVNVTVASTQNDVTVTSGTAVVGLFGADSVNSRLVQFVGATQIFPMLPAGAKVINPANGALFRLGSGQNQWKVDYLRNYSVTLNIQEAV